MASDSVSITPETIFIIIDDPAEVELSGLIEPVTDIIDLDEPDDVLLVEFTVASIDTSVRPDPVAVEFDEVDVPETDAMSEAVPDVVDTSDDT